MRRWTTRFVVLCMVCALAPTVNLSAANGGYTLVGWNDLGMHCMDADYSVLSILPPYNTIHAQLIDPSGNLVTSPGGITVTYEAVADPAGSINTTSIGKLNFWDYVSAIFGVSLAPDEGLAGYDMPGPSNTPQVMHYEPALQWFTAEGIPLTPYDDSGNKNYYPLMRLVARDASGQVLATTRIVLPISDEMTCIACHASGSGPAAEPSGGWINAADRERDYRLNILLLHDDLEGGSPVFQAALSAAGYSSSGLYATDTADGTPVLCDACHGSNALPGTGQAGIKPLTEAVHTRHAGVIDPGNGMTLDASANRAACYNCHPGAETRCLRGAMGAAVAADGSLAMQCQSCHGSMTQVGTPGRAGWFDEPTCQSCHTGTATHNNGQIRYTSAFDGSGQPRVAVDQTFATDPNTPVAGASLFRFSTGHGGLQCEACHGSTHAIFPSADVNDNLQSLDLQGHAGMLVDCATCHNTQPQTTSGGPHGMHPVGQSWAEHHGDTAEHNRSQCQACHGTDYRGSVLSRSQGNRTISAFGTKNFWRGFQIGCYTCHNGPGSESSNSNHAPVVSDVQANTDSGLPVAIHLSASDADGNSLTLRVVSQPTHGTAGLTGATATYYPEAGFSGSDSFTFAAWDGFTNSNLGAATVAVAGGSGGCTVDCSASVPTTADAGTAVGFAATASPSSCSGAPSYAWNFGDGSSSSSASTSHTYSAAGTYHWTLTVTAGDVTCSRSGDITVSSAPSPCTVDCSTTVPATGEAGGAVSFAATANPSDCSGAPTFAWSFGDGSGASSASTSHTYSAAGTYHWTLSVTAGDAICRRSGDITVGAAPSPCDLVCSTEVTNRARTGESVHFHGGASAEECDGTPSISWSFGDGATGTGKEPLHAYTSRGTYTWQMQAVLGSSTCSSSGSIQVRGHGNHVSNVIGAEHGD